MLAELHKHYVQKGVVFLGASLDDESTQPGIQALAKKKNIVYPLLLGATMDQMKALGLGHAVPVTIFF
jgi:hypothetical protein